MQLPKKAFLLLLILEVFVNFSGIAMPFFSNDPALYASIAKAMVQRNDFINLFVYGIDWLDKPHFPFWMAAFSFKLFGVHEWSYRLPALLFILLGCYYTFLLAKKLYNINVAQTAVLILLSAQHLLMSNTDVRAEPYLLALITGSVYHFYNLFQKFSFSDWIVGSLLAGCAVMTKGIFALVPVGTAIVGYAFFANQFKLLFQWRWLLAILLTAIFILPEVYTVYVQFDKHPGKIVFDTTGVSGVKWFLWDSQFSRFVNNGPITRPKGDVFYYVHTLLWAYAPWCLLFYFALAKKIIAVIKNRKLKEYLTLCAFMPMLLFFSLSKFQLNFYTNILFPFFSILVASFLSKNFSRGEQRYFAITQIFYSCVFIIGVLVINFLLKPLHQWIYFFGWMILLSGIVIIFITIRLRQLKWFLISCLSVLFVNFCFNLTLYPMMSLMKGENQAAAFVNSNYSNAKLGVFQNRRNGFEFYASQPVQQVNMNSWIAGAERDRIYYVDDIAYTTLLSKHATFRILQEFTDFNSESVSGKFINARTRNETFHKAYLIQ